MNLPGLFVVGTDTGVGKTHVASRIARCWSLNGCRVGVLKPVASGAESIDGRLISDDAQQLIASIGGGIDQDRVALMLFEEPLAPPVAARRLGSSLEMSDLLRKVAAGLAWWSEHAEVLIVEGVGGLLCPLAESTTVADLAIALDYPLLIVAHRGLGTLNHTLLTVEAARSRGLRIAGIVLNGASPTSNLIAEQTNAAELARRMQQISILADWTHQAEFSESSVAPEALGWYDLAKPPRHARQVLPSPMLENALRPSSLP